MNKIIFSLFTIYQLSLGNRLLLQGGTAIVPAPVTPAPETTAAVAPAPPAAAPAVSIINIIPAPANPNGGGGPMGELTCDMPCTTSASCPSACAQQRVQPELAVGTGRQPMVVEAGNFFKMDCAAAGACAASDFIINTNSRFVESLTFSERYAVFGSTITVNGGDPNSRTEIKTVDCGEASCDGALFIFNGCDLGDFICAPVDIGVGCGDTCRVIIDGLEQTCNSLATW